MPSKFPLQNLLSYKTVLIAIPGLVTMIAIAAILTSMKTGQDSASRNRVPSPAPKGTQVQKSLNQAQPTPPIIAAQPLEKKQSKISSHSKKAVNATPLKSVAPQKSTTANASSVTKKSQKAALAKKTADQPPKQPQALSKRRPSSSQSVLTMKGFDPTAAQDVPDIPLRVAIVRGAQNFTVATSEPGVITDSTGQILANTTAQGGARVSAQAGGINVGTVDSQSSIWIRPQTEKGLVFVNDRWYRGLVEVIADQGTLLAVNHVEMQPYLYSVVGAEMYHSWPAHALKAQAVAARSYALVHIVRPASPHFDLGSTQRWQAYKGVGSEAASTQSAVDKTRGVVISYEGGIVESLYASSSELVRDAHKGFGMSQYGARDLAQQNLTYHQILNRFYPGTELSLLQNK